MVFGRTKSVCPVCLRVIDAEKTTGADGNIYMEKTCPEHGHFSALIWEGDLRSYLRWGTVSSTVEPPVDAKAPGEGCPYDCGLCTEHLRKGCCMLLELTNRCNLRCPVCFAAAGEKEPYDLPLDEIERQYDFLMAHGGPFNIQLSGGEPTVRDDLPEIIRLGREKGFTFFQLNTNGLRLAREADYAAVLKAAGLNTVFLQFDGMTDEVYITLRGRALLKEKLAAVDNCERAGLGIVLVPVVAPGVNDMQVGDILRFALSRMPAVRGVHFQPVSYFGRCGLERPGRPITIPRMLRLIGEQTGGQMKVDSRLGEGTTVTAAFDTASIDCPPLGDMPGTVSLLVQGAPEGLEITYTRSTPKGGFRFDTRQVREILGPDVPLSSPDVAMWVRDFVAENEAEIT